MVIANDGLSVEVNPENTCATCRTVAQPKTMWGPANRTDYRPSEDDNATIQGVHGGAVG
ncbi:hypothetical protein GCM10022204_41320 [Microlunatus aurantiacus]|uniref:Uncharacterized protein n=1 Tax=Microlunatus aurantiacus TaxID=446786 RepID=A0ABP7ED31_9ACTN